MIQEDLLKNAQEFLSKKKAEKELLAAREKSLVYDIEVGGKDLEDLEKARWLLVEASRLTQEKVKGRVESLVTLALQGVFQKPLNFLVDFEIQRNKSECLLRIQEGDKEPYIPKDDKGGGVLDVVSFALRVVLHSMEKVPSRNIFILDEPGKWTGALISEFGAIVKELSEKLNIQILMVTHDPELIEVADRAWEVTHNGTFSEVKEVSGEKVVTTRRRKKE